MAEADPVDLMRRWVAHFNARQIEAMIELSDPTVEFNSAFAAVGGATYHGHHGLRAWHRDLEESWGEKIDLEPEAYFELGEKVLLLYVYRGRGRQSGAEVAMPAAAIAEFRDGLITHVEVYLDRADATAALGVDVAALEPLPP